MAADAAGNDLAAVEIPVTGNIAFAPYGTALPSTSDLANPSYVLPAAWTLGGLFPVDGAPNWTETKANPIEFFQDEYEMNAGNGTLDLTVRFAETSTAIQQILRGETFDGNGGMDIDVDGPAGLRYAVFTETINKSGNIERRVAPNCWVGALVDDKPTRGEVRGCTATFRVKRDSSLSGKHYRKVLIPADSTPPPAILSIAPVGQGIGDHIYISGYAFTGATDVTVDGETADFMVVSDELLDVIIPALAAGAAPVVVTTPNGTATVSYTVV